MHNADLESIIVKPSEMSTRTTFKLLFENLEKSLAVFKTIPGAIHQPERIADFAVKTLDLAAAFVTLFQFGRFPGADAAITIEAECVLQMTMSLIRGAPMIIGDGDLFSRCNKPDGIDIFVS